MGAVGVPSHPGPLRDRDFTTEERVRSSHAVDELGNGRIEAEELVKNGG